ncbi:hypothetical protein MJD09_20490 [bacterium]|nr:hypothetical protein [bacterium]
MKAEEVKARYSLWRRISGGKLITSISVIGLLLGCTPAAEEAANEDTSDRIVDDGGDNPINAKIASKNIDPGLWFRQGKNATVLEKSIVTLNTNGRGFFVKFADVKYRRNRYYILSSITPEIQVFDSTGEYLRTIAIEPRPKAGFTLTDFEVTNDLHIYVKACNTSIIYETDSTGTVLREYSPKLDNPDSKTALMYHGLQVSQSGPEKSVYSSVFQWLPGKFDAQRYMRETLNVGRFNSDGHLVGEFAKNHPYYLRYNLRDFDVSTFVIFEHELFLLERALPIVRVFSLGGKFLRQFGEPGMHQKAITYHKNESKEQKEAYWRQHSTYYNLKILPRLEGVAGAILAVAYFNPNPEPTEGVELVHEINNNFLILYTPAGELVANDLKLQGRLYDIDEESRLILLQNNDPGKMVFGTHEVVMSVGPETAQASAVQ